MIAIISRDQFFCTACKFLFSDSLVVMFDKMSVYTASEIRPDTLIIDLLCGDGLSLEQAREIETIDAGRIFLLCTFRASRMSARSPVFFVYRNLTVEMFSQFIKDTKSVICITEPQFSVMQIEVIRQFHRFKSEKKVADILGISYATVRIHKYNIMLKLRLRKMCHIVNTEFNNYMIDS